MFKTTKKPDNSCLQPAEGCEVFCIEKEIGDRNFTCDREMLEIKFPYFLNPNRVDQPPQKGSRIVIKSADGSIYISHNFSIDFLNNIDAMNTLLQKLISNTVLREYYLIEFMPTPEQSENFDIIRLKSKNTCKSKGLIGDFYGYESGLIVETKGSDPVLDDGDSLTSALVELYDCDSDKLTGDVLNMFLDLNNVNFIGRGCFNINEMVKPFVKSLPPCLEEMKNCQPITQEDFVRKFKFLIDGEETECFSFIDAIAEKHRCSDCYECDDERGGFFKLSNTEIERVSYLYALTNEDFFITINWLDANGTNTKTVGVFKKGLNIFELSKSWLKCLFGLDEFNPIGDVEFSISEPLNSLFLDLTDADGFYESLTVHSQTDVTVCIEEPDGYVSYFVPNVEAGREYCITFELDNPDNLDIQYRVAQIYDDLIESVTVNGNTVQIKFIAESSDTGVQIRFSGFIGCIGLKDMFVTYALPEDVVEIDITSADQFSSDQEIDFIRGNCFQDGGFSFFSPEDLNLLAANNQLSISTLLRFGDLTGTQTIFKDGGRLRGVALGLENDALVLSVMSNGTPYKASIPFSSLSSLDLVNDEHYVLAAVDGTIGRIFLKIGSMVETVDFNVVFDADGSHGSNVGNNYSPFTNTYQSPFDGSTDVEQRFKGCIRNVVVWDEYNETPNFYNNSTQGLFDAWDLNVEPETEIQGGFGSGVSLTVSGASTWYEYTGNSATIEVGNDSVCLDIPAGASVDALFDNLPIGFSNWVLQLTYAIQPYQVGSGTGGVGIHLLETFYRAQLNDSFNTTINSSSNYKLPFVGSWNEIEDDGNELTTSNFGLPKFIPNTERVVTTRFRLYLNTEANPSLPNENPKYLFVVKHKPSPTSPEQVIHTSEYVFLDEEPLYYHDINATFLAQFLNGQNEYTFEVYLDTSDGDFERVVTVGSATEFSLVNGSPNGSEVETLNPIEMTVTNHTTEEIIQNLEGAGTIQVPIQENVSGEFVNVNFAPLLEQGAAICISEMKLMAVSDDADSCELLTEAIDVSRFEFLDCQLDHPETFVFKTNCGTYEAIQTTSIMTIKKKTDFDVFTSCQTCSGLNQGREKSIMNFREQFNEFTVAIPNSKDKVRFINEFLGSRDAYLKRGTRLLPIIPIKKNYEILSEGSYGDVEFTFQLDFNNIDLIGDCSECGCDSCNSSETTFNTEGFSIYEVVANYKVSVNDCVALFSLENVLLSKPKNLTDFGNVAFKLEYTLSNGTTQSTGLPIPMVFEDLGTDILANGELLINICEEDLLNLIDLKVIVGVFQNGYFRNVDVSSSTNLEVGKYYQGSGKINFF